MAREMKSLLEITAGCDTECLFCLRNIVRKRSGSPGAIDFEALRDFFILSRRLGSLEVELAGDEPTMLGLGSLSRILADCRKAGFGVIRMVSNGVKLGEKGFLEKMIALGINDFVLPLYGPNEMIHDAVTQVPGSFRAGRCAREAILRRADSVHLLLHTVLIRQNEDSLDQMRTMASQWGVGLRVDRLLEGDSHVDYSNLRPSRPGTKVPASVGIGQKADEPPTAAERSNGTLIYNLFRADIRWGDGMGHILRTSLQALGAPPEILENVLEDFAKKPIFEDPRRVRLLFDLASSRRYDHVEFEVAKARSARHALELGLRRLVKNNRAEAVSLLREARLFKTVREQERWAKEKAVRVLEGLGAPRA
jgi:pyruvate-formate lyase-activating enzyme